MTKKQTTLWVIGGTIFGIIGTAFSMGADKQRINDILIQHTTQMEAIGKADIAHEKTTQKELDRFAEIIAAQMILIQGGISNLDDTVNDLCISVNVLQVLMQRVERDIQKGIEIN